MRWPFRFRASLPRVESGRRLYAVGDVHGCHALLVRLLERIDAHRAAHPGPDCVTLFLGDYIDRGPSSNEVLSTLVEQSRQRGTICLKGNHEVFLLQFLDDPGIYAEWARYGGLTTLMSYGIVPPPNADRAEQAALSDALRGAMPDDHRRFLEGLFPSHTSGDYFFVHAGIRPGVPLDRQSEDDLFWIREEFLLHEGRFEKHVVHGHTPVLAPQRLANRTNIDTGAYATGKLTCLVLENDEASFL